MSRVPFAGLAFAVSVLLATAPVHAQKTFLNKDAAAWVKDLADDASEAKRRSAAFALGKLGGDAIAALPALKHALAKDPSAKVREAATVALGEISRGNITAAADPQLLPLLTQALKDTAWPVRRSAAFALGCLESQAEPAREQLEAALADTSPEVRQNVAWALGRVSAAAIPKLRDALRDTDPFVKRDAAQSLYLIEDPVPIRAALGELLAVVQENNSEARRASVRVLIRIIGPEDGKVAAAPLRAVLLDADEEIRTNGALALANIGGKEAALAVPTLVQALNRGEIALKRQAAAGLRNIGPDAAKAVPDLMGALNNTDTELRTNAALALGGIGPPAEKAVPALVKFLVNTKEEQPLRMAAAVALSSIGPVPAAIDAVPRLAQLIGKAADDGVVRWRTVWALRVHDRELGKIDGVYAALQRVLTEPKTEDNRMLRYDCAYMLGVLQGRETTKEVLDTLAEFLKDDRVQVYVSTQATVQGAGQETGVGKATVKERGKDDGRILATQALKAIGAARIRQRPEIVQQLEILFRDPKTFGKLRKDCAELLQELKK